MTTGPPDGRTPALDAGLGEVARFLARRPPFDALAPAELAQVARGAAIEFHPRGATILSPAGGPVTHLRVVLSGAVDVLHEDRLLDLLGPGDTLGDAAMLSGLPPGFEARAAEDTLCYRIGLEVAAPLLDRARRRELNAGLAAPAHRPVAELIRAPTVRCRPAESIATVSARMTEAGANAAVVDLDDGGVGIITDRDLRTRVLAVGRAGDVRVDTAMTAPAWTVEPDRLAGEVLYEMLERGLRHAPVRDSAGRLVGVVEDADLVAAQPRSWFGLRREIDRARSLPALEHAAARLPELMLELYRSSVATLALAPVLSALVDALTRRALELAGAAGSSDGGRTAEPGLVWVAVGSQARRELTPGSTRRGALIHPTGAPPDPEWLAAAQAGLAVCGISGPIAAHDAAGWAALAARASGAAPAGGTDELALSVLADRRILWGQAREPLPATGPGGSADIAAALARRAFATALPTGFDADTVLSAQGRHENLNIRETTIVPIAAIARWAAPDQSGTTPERLAAAADAGVLRADQSQTLAEAFQIALELRIVHQLERLAAGQAPDDLLDPAELSPLTRGHLRDVFRAVQAVAAELNR